jgi:hypothetical protein
MNKVICPYRAREVNSIRVCREDFASAKIKRGQFALFVRTLALLELPVEP